MKNKNVLTQHNLQIVLIIICFCIEKSFSSNIRNINEYGNCKYTLNDGYNVDFTHLKKSTDYIFQVNRYSYYANFCRPLVNACPNSNAPAAIFIKSKFYIFLQYFKINYFLFKKIYFLF